MRTNAFLSGLAILGFSVLGCASRPAPQSPASAVTTPKTTSGDSARLVVRAEVVRACPALRTVHDGARSPDAAWTTVFHDLADCMKTGSLQGRTILVRGSRAGRDLVANALVERGIAADRLTAAPSARAEDANVEIALFVAVVPIDPSST